MAQYEQVASFLASKTHYRPQIGIICGSGLSGLSKSLTETQTFKYEDIPGFPLATIAGHAGELVFGMLGGIETVCMRGRFHFYEGNTMDMVVMPVKAMRLLGVKLLIVTNAAGGLNPEFNVGDIMVIQDHFGAPIIAGNTPLRGHNDESLGPRFPSVSDSYDPTLQEFVKNSAEKLGFSDKVRYNGTYCFMAGPQYESRAECRFLRLIGGDSVGMSTVPEVLIARHCGMKVLGLSLITNKVVLNADESHHANHEEVLAAVDQSGKYVEAIVKDIARADVLGQFLDKQPAFVYESKMPQTTKTASCECANTAPCGNSCGANCVCGKSPCTCASSAQCGGACGADCKCAACACGPAGKCGGDCGENCKCSKSTSSCCAKKSSCCEEKSCCEKSKCACCGNGVVALVGLAVVVGGLFYVLKNKK